MREPVVVSYARTGLAKSARGGFNNTPAVTMLAHAIKHAVERAKIEPGEVEDVVAGQVAGSGNTGRNAALLCWPTHHDLRRHRQSRMLFGLQASQSPLVMSSTTAPTLSSAAGSTRLPIRAAAAAVANPNWRKCTQTSGCP